MCAQYDSEPSRVCSDSLSINTGPFIFAFLLFHFSSLQSYMAEEFQESEVIFSDLDHRRYLHRADDDDCGEDFFNLNCRGGMVVAPRNKYQQRTVRDGGRLSKKVMASSLPVGIPERNRRRTTEEEDEMDEEEMIPPHVVAERRMAGKMAFSVCTGNGRTLKGRDLRRVRNSILRMTGFLET
ncbi:hypothetical protein SDJN02_18508, partial [Cucurbita argyrosperma subsp. argyrosperma]|uniref:Uncharacterized protein LOC111434057 n=2 Tax=Cucurbita TaxID=3660 RepID=A0A6J1EK43_CUCMO